MGTRSQWTTITSRASEIKAGEIALIGGTVFTRLKERGQLSRAAKIQKPRFVEVVGTWRYILNEPAINSGEEKVTWVELEFMGGDCPDNSRTMYALYRPHELLKVQVEKL